MTLHPHFSPHHPLFVCAQNTPPSCCHSVLLGELINVLSFPSSLVFDDNQKRQGICSSSVIPRNAYAFRQGIYDVFIISSILFKSEDRWTILLNVKSSDDATLQRAMTHQKKALSRTPFFYFFTFGNQLPCVINSQTGGYRIIAGTIGVIAPNIAV